MRIKEGICSSWTAVLVIFPVILFSSISFAQWTRFHGNSHNTGVYPGGLGREGAFSQLWSYPMKLTQRSSPALADLDDDGMLEVIIGCNEDTLYALNGEDGSILWRYTVATGPSVITSPVVGDIDGDQKPEVVFATYGFLTALQGESGELIWSVPIDGGLTRSPCIADLDGSGGSEVVFTGRSNTTTHNGETGDLLWTATGYFATGTSFTVAEDVYSDGACEVMAFTFTGGPTFSLLDGANGNPVWSTQVPMASGCVNTPAPAFTDLDLDGFPEIVGCSASSYVYVLDALSGLIRWSVNVNSDVESSPVVADIDGNDSLEIIVACLNTKELRAYSCTGELLWTTATDYLPWQTAAIADIDGDQVLEIIQASSIKGGTTSSIQVFNASTGEEEWSIPTSGIMSASPAVGDLDNDGYFDIVYALDNSYVTVLSTGIQGIDPQLAEQSLQMSIGPNPFTTRAFISFTLSQSGFTSIEVFDLSGRVVSTVNNTILPRGEHTLEWNGTDMMGEQVSAGLYLCRIKTEGITRTMGLCLLR